jgi:hypothetical protein
MAALSLSLSLSRAFSSRGAVTSSYRTPLSYTAYLPRDRPSFLSGSLGTKLTLHCPWTEDQLGKGVTDNRGGGEPN